jgi:hypothetical protein
MWEFSLDPREKRMVRFDFAIESPQGMEIIGLPYAEPLISGLSFSRPD